MSRVATIQRFREEAPALRVLKRIVGAFLIVYAPLALFSGYRAIWQLYSVSLHADPVLRAGSVVRYGAIGSGRVAMRVQLELVQAGHIDTLASHWVREHTERSLDPRPIRGDFEVQLTREQLARFTPGSATLRTISFGGMQWLRTPPPKSVEKVVTIQR